ncbi:Hsp20 family protein [Ferrimonas marina]|uniref:Molecular chaperone IbpA n=1 Tax=Ferrimonas marina TaxID=299255 RepID=A0A1M5UA32_9GAMM|nr:Hsp20 family protein [Ferrimonas marina]SHH59790.1 molecular chaperone IbpA [Ferrimonas marina]
MSFQTIDFSPLFRSTIGFDVMPRMFDEALKPDGNYPPHNVIAINEDEYQIDIAVAGFKKDELGVELHGDKLSITGRKENKEVDVDYLHRGVALRDFTKAFRLAEHVHLKSALLDHGFLSIRLEREVPETEMPKTIPIST